MTLASIGHGSKFSVGDGGSPEVWTDTAEVVTITPPAIVRDTPDATHMGSPERWREFIPGLRDPGEATIVLNFIPGGADQQEFFLGFTADVMLHYRITFPNAEIWEFSAYCVGFAPEDPLDAKMSATVRFKLSGKPVFITA